MHTQTDRQTDRHTHTHTHGCTYTHTDSGKYSLVVFCKRPPSEARYLDGATCKPIYKATLRLPRYIPIIAFPQYESESTANFTDPLSSIILWCVLAATWLCSVHSRN